MLSMEADMLLPITLAAVKRGVRSFSQSKRGNVGPMAGAVVMTMVIAVGVSTDLMRAYSAQSRLAAALDAAALAAGASTGNPGTLTDVAGKYLNINFPLGGGVTQPATVNTMSVTTTPIVISATAGVDTAFLQLIGISTLYVTASSSVVREMRGLEVAFVLDNTGSMMASSGGVTNMAALKQAAGQVVTKLFGSNTDANPLLRVALVPFTASVNPVPTAFPLLNHPTSASFASSLISSATLPTYIPSTYTYAAPVTDASKWMGCVKESSAFTSLGSAPTATAAATALDTAITTASGAFTPYYWQPEWKNTNNSQCYLASSHSTLTSTGVCNTWTASSVSATPWVWGSDAVVGPNRSCPTPITPLTNSMAPVIAAIGLNTDGTSKTTAGMGAWNNGGTLGSVGMAWGYRVLSPSGPYTSISTVNPWTTTLWQKAVVLMTDGTNDYYNNQYSAYGPYQTSFAVTTVEAQEKSICDALRNKGVIIYSIYFNTSTPSTSTAVRYCAGTTAGSGNDAYFYNAKSQTDLSNAFNTIGNQLSNLRVSQ
jgi:hypothetical protein